MPPRKHAGRGRMGTQRGRERDRRAARPVGARPGAAGVACGVRVLRGAACWRRAAVRPLCSLLSSACGNMLCTPR